MHEFQLNKVISIIKPEALYYGSRHFADDDASTAVNFRKLLRNIDGLFRILDYSLQYNASQQVSHATRFDVYSVVL